MSHQDFDALTAALTRVRPLRRDFGSQEAYLAAFRTWVEAIHSVAETCRSCGFNAVLFCRACDLNT